MIYILFVIFIVIASLLMIGIVLIQESKGGGLASNFSSSNAIMGVRKTTDFVEKATWGLAASLVVFSIVCAHFAPVSSTESSVMEKTATEILTQLLVSAQASRLRLQVPSRLHQLPMALLRLRHSRLLLSQPTKG